jgi:cytochrome c5
MWRDSRAAATLLAATLLAAVPARADESSLVLADGEGVAQVKAFCAICHSVDYILMNSPIQDAAGWDKTVTKMVKVMGAPITPEDSKVIVAYLAKHYGKDSGG